MKDEIVALLPDLRAFARFMCREREAADDLVQNTVLAALDKQTQFAPWHQSQGVAVHHNAKPVLLGPENAAPPPAHD